MPRTDLWSGDGWFWLRVACYWLSGQLSQPAGGELWLPYELLTADGMIQDAGAHSRQLNDPDYDARIPAYKRRATVSMSLRFPARVTHGPRMQSLLHLGQHRHGALRLLWCPGELGGTVWAGTSQQMLHEAPASWIDPARAQLISLVYDGDGKMQLAVDGKEELVISGVQPDVGAHPKFLVGKPRRGGEANFTGEVLDVRVWLGYGIPEKDLAAMGTRLDVDPPPTAQHHRRGLCMAASDDRWTQLHLAFSRTLGCAVDWKNCHLPKPPYRFLITLVDEITNRPPEEWPSVAHQCAVGFSAALAVYALYLLLEIEADPGMAAQVLYLINAQVPNVRSPDPVFGLARPVSMLRKLRQITRRNLFATLSMAAAVGSINVEESLQLCIAVRHGSLVPLALLRNSIESLAAGAVFRRGAALVVHLDDCSGIWADPETMEGWYVKWLQQRLGAEIACGAGAVVCNGHAVELHLISGWNLLPLHPNVIYARLREATEVLRDRSQSGQVVAVSLLEKTIHSTGGLGKSAREALNHWATGGQVTAASMKALSLAALSLTGTWDLTSAQQTATSLRTLYAVGASSPLAEELTKGKSCNPKHPDMLCVPAEWWGAQGPQSGSDVWLLPGSASPALTGFPLVALSRGLFQRSIGTDYDPTAAAQSLGIPDCFACHSASVEKDLEVFFVPLDVIGPCRELFSNLFMDTLEELHLASFQGPHAVLVEPKIINAVWQRFGEEDAKKLGEVGGKTSIYKYWNAQGACGLRHGRAVDFSEMFDWHQLVSWLQQTRGVKRGASWKEFISTTKATLDMVAMLSDHPGDKNHGEERIPCGDSNEAVNARFYGDELTLRRRVCVRSTKKGQQGGFELRFLDYEKLAAAVKQAVALAQEEGRTRVAVGLFLYWIEGAERARLHPARYGKLSSHVFYSSIWDGLRFAPAIHERAHAVRSELGIGDGVPFLAAHWRRGDWFLGPHPRKLEQAALADPHSWARILQRYLHEYKLQHVFLMTNAAADSDDIKNLRAHVTDATLVQAPLLPGGDAVALQQLCVEMAVAAEANFFIAFGDGLVQGHASMPSLLVLQMRLHAQSWAFESNAFAFTSWDQNALGI